MDFHEYQAKSVFARHNVATSQGEVTDSAEGAGAIARRLGGAVVVKAQVHTGGRGKAGGVAVVGDPEAAAAAAARILGMDIRGHEVGQVLVEPAADIATEIYLAITLDRGRRRSVVMASREGGVDIEEVAATAPTAILREVIDPLIGLQPYQSRSVAYRLGLEGPQVGAFQALAAGLADAYAAWDATLTEINPLIVTGSGELLAIDAKMSIDDNALYRQPGAVAMSDRGHETAAEKTAREAGLSYVDLDGSIGCLVNGAGLAMATMDVIKFFGGEPANFLDIGGGAKAEKVEAAMRIILADSAVRSVLVNIFGGITRGDEVATGLLQAIDNIGVDVPIVARIVGTNAEAGRQILAAANLETATTLAEAAQKAVALAAGAPAGARS